MPSQPHHQLEKYVLTHNLHLRRPDHTLPSSPQVQASVPTPDIPRGLTAVTQPPPTTMALLWADPGGHHLPAQQGLNRCWQSSLLRGERNLGLCCLSSILPGSTLAPAPRNYPAPLPLKAAELRMQPFLSSSEQGDAKSCRKEK